MSGAEAPDTIAGLRAWARRLFAEAGVDSPALDAELLLAHVLGVDRPWVLARPEHMLTAAERRQFLSLVARRRQREPLAYILGRVPFCGLELLVSPAVLIPRPETEELVEHAAAWLYNSEKAGAELASLRIADVGTGSGAIAIALAHRFPDIRVLAVERSPDALEIAAANVRRHHLQGRVHLLAGDMLEPLGGKLHLILANLPYIASSELPSLMPEVSRYEPRQALDGGADGLDPLRRLLEQAACRLAGGGALMAEIGAGQGAAALEAARRHFPGVALEVRKDLAGFDRFLIIQMRDASSAQAG